MTVRSGSPVVHDGRALRAEPLAERTAGKTDRRPARRRMRPLVVSVALAAAGLMTYVASASFSTAATVTTTTATGAMDLVLGAEGTVANRLTVAAALAPGESADRQARLTIDNDGGTMAAVRLTTSGTNGPPTFFTDADDGMTLWIARCTEPWTESGSSPAFAYSCGGTSADVLGTSGAPVPLAQTATALVNLDLDDGAVNHLRVRITFPAGAPASMIGESSDIDFAFEGVQRAGTAR